MSGVPVLITIDGIGPIAGRLFVEWRDVEALWEGDVGARPEPRGAWRVEIDEVPKRHVDAIWRAVNHLGPAAQIRIWGKAEAAHYVGMAYGRLGDPPLRGGARSLTLLGNGQATRVRS